MFVLCVPSMSPLRAQKLSMRFQNTMPRRAEAPCFSWGFFALSHAIKRATFRAVGTPQLRSKRIRGAPEGKPGLQVGGSARTSSLNSRPAKTTVASPVLTGGFAQAVTSDADVQDRKFIHALLLAGFASSNRSLLPMRCLVETATEMYQRGLWLQDLQLAISVASEHLVCSALQQVAAQPRSLWL